MTVDWASVRLVVFDVDGTLYDQSPLRLAMTRRLAARCLRSGGLRTVLIVRAFRKVREELGDRPVADGVDEAYRRTARLCRCGDAEVRAVVERWIEREPLPLLPAVKARGIDPVFAALRRSGRRIAAWSDYPARNKLASLGLTADLAVCAGDAEVCALKPDPAGLARILHRTGIAADQTLMVGDRFDRDWQAASALQVRTLIRSRRADRRSPTFRDFRDPVFAPLLAEAGHA